MNIIKNQPNEKKCKRQRLASKANLPIAKAAHFPHHPPAHSGSSGVFLPEDPPGIDVLWFLGCWVVGSDVSLGQEEQVLGESPDPTRATPLCKWNLCASTPSKKLLDYTASQWACASPSFIGMNSNVFLKAEKGMRVTVSTCAAVASPLSPHPPGQGVSPYQSRMVWKLLATCHWFFFPPQEQPSSLSLREKI